MVECGAPGNERCRPSRAQAYPSRPARSEPRSARLVIAWGRKVLAEVATVARPDIPWPGTVSWSPVNSLARSSRSGPTAAQARGGATDHSHGEREPGLGLRPDRGRHGRSRVCDPIRRLAMFRDGTACHPLRSASARPRGPFEPTWPCWREPTSSPQLCCWQTPKVSPNIAARSTGKATKG
jgi:hypothetical protein